LPGFMLEQILEEEDTGVRRIFLDFFNNRLTGLLHQVWRKYRYYVCFKDDASDIFSSRLFALVGLAEKDMRTNTTINWCKMLSYAGMLAGRARSPQVVSGIIAHCFDLKHVTIKQWIKRKVDIPQEQRVKLGKVNTTLGADLIIGSHVNDCMGKFKICLHDLSVTRFAQFLPSGEHFDGLAKLVEFILREQMAFDLQLEMSPANQGLGMSLSSDKPAALGWSSFTGNNIVNRTATISVRH